MAQITVPQPQPQAQNLLEKPFSLAPAIFTTFTALSKEPQPTGPEEKINRILQNLNTQHEAVRMNMLGLLQARSRFLVQKAEEELAGLDDESVGDEEDHGSGPKSAEVNRSREEMLRKTRVKIREGAKAEDYEVKPGNAEFTSSFPERSDVEMFDALSSRTKHQIRKSLSNELRDLVDDGVIKLEAYKNHAAESTNMYKQALERRKGRFGSISGAAAQSPEATGSGGGGGILRNGHEQSPIDPVAIRRMSTGMPVATPPVQAVRTFENFEEVARRGSTSK